MIYWPAWSVFRNHGSAVVFQLSNLKKMCPRGSKADVAVRIAAIVVRIADMVVRIEKERKRKKCLFKLKAFDITMSSYRHGSAYC